MVLLDQTHPGTKRDYRIRVAVTVTGTVTVGVGVTVTVRITVTVTVAVGARVTVTVGVGGRVGPGMKTAADTVSLLALFFAASFAAFASACVRGRTGSRLTGS